MAREEIDRVLDGRRGNSFGVGLSNVHDRLRTIYGPEHGIQLESTLGEGTRVVFSIPKFRAGVAA
jgi:two-component system LytT family sensor kinase